VNSVAGDIRRHFKAAFGLPDAAVDKLVETSRTALAQGLGSLRGALSRSDADEASHWAHSVKGNLLNAGLPHLAAQAEDIERLAMRGDTATSGPSMVRLDEALRLFLNGH
jgi:HPt (histidine-containing phosphotransfer) domain-containing protein